MIEHTSQIFLIHLSDIHFGKNHRFAPPLTPLGDKPLDKSFPSLIAKLSQDLEGPDPGCPVVICITGDLTEFSELSEFKEAERFVTELARINIFGRPRGIDSIFLVPGNHDVDYNASEVGDRWQQWTEFYNRLYRTSIFRENPLDFAEVHDRFGDLQSVIITLNSAIYVERGKPDEERGRLDIDQLTKIEERLGDIDRDRLGKSVRIALIHHHPILIPSLSEPGRGYDAVHNSGTLLSILRRYGFHAILHGHKHSPHTFTDDSQPAHQDRFDLPILIAAGGSVGSTDLPRHPRLVNCYNRMTIKWHPVACQCRVQVDTRGLNTFKTDGAERLPTHWNWTTMRVDDRHFFGFDCTPVPKRLEERNFDPEADDKYETLRHKEYEVTRGNLPVVQVLPSLIPGQAYEALLWIVPHPHKQVESDHEYPIEVTWSAGRKFEVVTIKYEDDKHFCASLAYWGPMLVQTRLKFADGHEALSYVYARMPESYG